MADIKLPFVHIFADARGKRRHVFRRKGHKTVTLRGKPGSPEYLAHHQELVEVTAPATIGASKAKAGTVDAVVISWFKDDVFTRGLAKETQNTWRPIIDRPQDSWRAPVR